MYYASENWSFPTPQTGQVQSSGSSLNAFPSTLGSYSYPQTSQMYFAIVVLFKKLLRFFPYITTKSKLFRVQRYKENLIYANFGGGFVKNLNFSLVSHNN